MINYTAEAIGTALLILFGDGVVANVLLARSKGEKSGWIVITFGWAVAVMIAVYAVGRLSGAHLNPAVTVALASIGAFPWADVPGYIAAQMIGAIIGAALVWLTVPTTLVSHPGRGLEARRLLHGTGSPSSGREFPD